VIFIVADACSLMNFAAIARPDLAKIALRGRGRCTEAVSHEIKQSVGYLPALGQLLDELGSPIKLSRQGDAAAVDRNRIALGGVSVGPLKHLGEAESIHAILSRPELAGATLLTDDHGAQHLAESRSIVVWDTTDLLLDARAMGDISWAEAREVLNQMRQKGRGVRVPASERDFR
jgi:predicted nucleic acid-binding protein